MKHTAWILAFASLFAVQNAFAATNIGTDITTGGNLTLSAISGLTQCLHVNSSGLVSGTGSDCGAGGASLFNYPFTPANNYAQNDQATTGIAWFQNGLNASSTSNFVYASTTMVSAATASTTNLILAIFGSTQCLQVNSSGIVSGTGSTCGTGGSSFAYPLTPASNYGSTEQATTGIAWFQNGVNASSTSNFVYASTTMTSSATASSTNAYVSSLGKPAGTFIAADPSGKLIATTSPGGSLATPVSIANGGTNASTNVTAAQNVGIMSVSAFGGGSVIGDLQTHPTSYVGQCATSANGTQTQYLWCGEGAQYDYTVSGLTVLPTQGATYDQGCGVTIIGTANITGSPGSYAGDLVAKANCVPSASGSMSKTGGTGDSTINWSAFNYLPSWVHSLAFSAGVTEIGDINNRLYNDNIQNTNWCFNCGLNGATAQGDSGLHLVDQSLNDSGNALNVDIMNDDGSVSDSVGAAFTAVPHNRAAQIIPGTMGLIFNENSTKMRGLCVGGPGLTGLGTANGCLTFTDFINQEFRVPNPVAGVFQPKDVAYTFTVSGITVTPAAGSIYTNNGVRFTVVSTSISGGSGTILATSEDGAPASSGTLTQASDGTNVFTGDATVSFSSEVKSGSWKDIFVADPIHARVGVGSSTPLAELSVQKSYGMTSSALLWVASSTASDDSSGNPLFNVLASGKVGVGTSTPSQALDVNGNINVEGAANGIILHDTATASCYLLQVTSGTLAVTSHACQ